MTEWSEAQQWEKKWWGTCQNTYGEEEKQFHYAKSMGLRFQGDSQGPYLNMKGTSVLDIGGGPVSLLLKCRNLGEGTVVDPCDYPSWVEDRYKASGIEYLKTPAEELNGGKIYDEVWIYNVLQHVEDPAKVVAVARKYGKIIRVFDWLEISGAGHPQHLTETEMNEWLGGEGKVVQGNGGKEYSGIFKGDHYE